MQPRGRVGHHAERKPVDHDAQAMRCGYEPGVRTSVGDRTWTGKFAAEIENPRLPAEPLELGDHAPIVDIASGRRGKVSRNGENEVTHHHNGASYHARADGDSPMVTRIALISRPSRPSLPARTASASRSYTYLVRNSVVVLTPLNCGSSSRLR